MDHRIRRRLLLTCANLASFFLIALAYDQIAQSFGAPSIGLIGAVLIAFVLSAATAVLTRKHRASRSADLADPQETLVARERVSVVVGMGVAILFLSLFTRAILAWEISRRHVLGSKHFCPCSDCELVYYVWSPDADRIYGLPLSELASVEAALRAAAVMTLTAGLLLGGALVIVQRVRPAPGSCPSCGYDRTGLSPNAICPECGSPPPLL